LWFDEIQTFGRTGELFAYQRLGLSQFVDVVTCAKPLLVGAVMWKESFAPKLGLIGGTFSGHSVAMAQGLKTLQLLCEKKSGQENYFGFEGRIQKLERFIKDDWQLRRTKPGNDMLMGKANITGGMLCFEVLNGKPDVVRKFLLRLFENGVVAFSAGRDPVMMRMLPPVGIMTEEIWKEVMDIVEKTLKEFSST